MQTHLRAEERAATGGTEWNTWRVPHIAPHRASRLLIPVLLPLIAPAVVLGTDATVSPTVVAHFTVHSDSKACAGHAAAAQNSYAEDMLDCARLCLATADCSFFSYWGSCYRRRCKLFEKPQCTELKQSSRDCVRTYRRVQADTRPEVGFDHPQEDHPPPVQLVPGGAQESGSPLYKTSEECAILDRPSIGSMRYHCARMECNRTEPGSDLEAIEGLAVVPLTLQFKYR